MKRFFALLLAAFMVCSMVTFSSFATRDYVISPEYTEIPDEDVPLTPPTEEIPDEDVPLAPIPQSPQTGDAFGVAGFAVVAVLCGAVAVVSSKKAATYS